ncbi:hypothetical protein RJI07_04955 [Mycoplasmatota bacterium WC30]
MIEIKVENMFCGHCKLKVKAELELNKYKVIKIDMDRNIVFIDAERIETYKITKILGRINYVVSNRTSSEDILELEVYNEKLNDDSYYGLFVTYLLDNIIETIGFNDGDCGIIILCTKTQYINAVKYLDEL